MMPISSNYSQSTTVDSASATPSGSASGTSSGGPSGFQELLASGQSSPQQPAPIPGQSNNGGQSTSQGQGDSSPGTNAGGTTERQKKVDPASAGVLVQFIQQYAIQSPIPQTGSESKKSVSTAGANTTATAVTASGASVGEVLTVALSKDGTTPTSTTVAGSARSDATLPANSAAGQADSANQLASLSKGLVTAAPSPFDAAATTTNTGSSTVLGKELHQGITTASTSTGAQVSPSGAVAGGAPYTESTQTLTELSTSTLSPASPSGVATGNPIPTQGVATGNPIPTLGGVAHPQGSPSDGQTLTNTRIAELAAAAGALSTKTGASDGAAKDTVQPGGGAITGVAQTILQSGASGLAQGLVGHIGQTAMANTANASQSNPIPLPITLNPSEDQQAIASIVTSHLASNPALPSMLHLRVHPEGMGNVDLLISSSTNGIHVAISASSQALHGYLSAHAHELRSTLGEGVGVNVQIDLSYSGGTESGAQGALDQGKASQMLSSSFWGTSTTTDGTATTLSDDRARLIDIIA